MRFLIVDALSSKRVEPLAAYLRGRGHDVVHHAMQLTVTPGDADHTEWNRLISDKDIVFLHVGEQQVYAITFFSAALVTVPAFCYSGGPIPHTITAACGTPGIHVACPLTLGRSLDSGHRFLAAALRWLEPLEAGIDSARFAKAWYCVRDIDAVRESQLESLDNDLVVTLTRHKWNPTEKTTEDLKQRLTELRTQRAGFGI